MEAFFNLLQTTELRVLVLAVFICILTALLKTPLKRWAKTRPNGASVTRFVTFLPVVLGLGLACLYERLATGALVWSEELFSLWIRSATLSLAIYAFVEKFVPSKQKILSEEELRANLALLEQLRSGVAAAGDDGEGDEGKGTAVDRTADGGEETAMPDEGADGTKTALPGNDGSAGIDLPEVLPEGAEGSALPGDAMQSAGAAEQPLTPDAPKGAEGAEAAPEEAKDGGAPAPAAEKFVLKGGNRPCA